MTLRSALGLKNQSLIQQHHVCSSIVYTSCLHINIICSSLAASDYILTNTSVTLTSSHFQKIYKIFIEFVDDEISEPELEYFEVIFEVASGEEIVEFVTAAFITLTIRDNDGMIST